MLAKIGSKDSLEKQGWIFEPKLDGTRVLIYKKGNCIKLTNRRGNDITYRYPELFGIGPRIKAENCVLDAELVILHRNKPNFNLLQQREQLDKKFMIELRSKQFPATLFVFDILELNGKTVINKKLKDRKEMLSKIITNSPNIVICPFASDGKALWKAVRAQKLEGIIAKNLESIYEPGKRSEQWLKIKNLNTIDTVVVGYTQGGGSRKAYFGSLVLAVYKEGTPVYVGKVGTGFSQQLLEQITKMMKKLITKHSVFTKEEEKRALANASVVKWLKPKLIAEIKFLEFTKDNELRAPVFLRFRFDKKPEECTLP